MSFFFLTVTDAVTSKNIVLSYLITLYTALQLFAYLLFLLFYFLLLRKTSLTFWLSVNFFVSVLVAWDFKRRFSNQYHYLPCLAVFFILLRLIFILFFLCTFPFALSYFPSFSYCVSVCLSVCVLCFPCVSSPICVFHWLQNFRCRCYGGGGGQKQGISYNLAKTATLFATLALKYQPGRFIGNCNQVRVLNFILTWRIPLPFVCISMLACACTSFFRYYWYLFLMNGIDIDQ
jgi:hypothetical protein